MKSYKLISIKTNKQVDEKDSVTTDPANGGPIEITYDYDKIKKTLNSYVYKTAPISCQKYLDLYPIKDYSNIITLQEGGTPLYESNKLKKDFGIKNLYFKYEGSNPTGSFKDRGSMVEVTKAIELGAKGICVASTGNMGASLAAYSAKANLDCYVFVPNGAPSGKLAQILSYGAKIIQVRGDYSVAFKLAEEAADKYGLYLAGDYCFRQEGQKSIGFEIIEQLLYKVPDYILVPVGMGTNISAIWKAFVEYKKLGLIDKLPKIVAVQAKGASPIIKSFKLNLKKISIVKETKTVASAISVGDPLYAIKVIDIIKKSKGFAIAVDDESTLDYQHKLAMNESIFVEPASATCLAALKELKKLKKIKSDATYICVLTGAGLKDPSSILKILAEPPTINADMKEVDKLMKSKILDIRSYGIKARDKTLFAKNPTKDKLKSTIKKEFKTNFTKNYLSEIALQLKQFLQKGKAVTKADMQYIIEDVLQSYVPKNKRVLEVLDFKILVRLNKPIIAEMTVRFKNKKVMVEKSGVGPVDAAINSLIAASSDNGYGKIKLTDYKVKINSAGTDASVDVDMTLENKDGEVIVANGTSPDIIQASIAAYVNGFNALHFNGGN